MQTKIPVVVPVIQVFATIQLLELSGGLCADSRVMQLVEVAYA
jgi:hypothetical protein